MRLSRSFELYFFPASIGSLLKVCLGTYLILAGAMNSLLISPGFFSDILRKVIRAAILITLPGAYCASLFTHVQFPLLRRRTYTDASIMVPFTFIRLIS